MNEVPIGSISNEGYMKVEGETAIVLTSIQILRTAIRPD